MGDKRIGILGLGAIGSVVANELLKNTAHQMRFFNRSPKTHLRVRSNDEWIDRPVDVMTSSKAVQVLDWLVICLKEYHYTGATEWWKHLIHPNTRIAVIRNGLRLKEPLLAYAPREHILECQIDCPVERAEDGFFQVLRPPILTVEESDLADEFRSLFTVGQATVNTTPDFKTESWKKLCESAALGAILCLSGETCWVFQDPEMRTLYANLLSEMLLVARADGAAIENDFVDQLMEKLNAYPPEKGSSMLTDRKRGNPIELGAKNGIVSELAKKYGVPTPINDTTVLLMRHINQK